MHIRILFSVDSGKFLGSDANACFELRLAQTQLFLYFIFLPLELRHFLSKHEPGKFSAWHLLAVDVVIELPIERLSYRVTDVVIHCRDQFV